MALILVVTLLIWTMAGFVLIGTMMGDCAATSIPICPTETDRLLRLLWIVLGAAGLNATLVALLVLPGRDVR